MKIAVARLNRVGPKRRRFVPVANVSAEESLRRSQQFCRRVAIEHAKSFYFASLPLPPEKRRAAYSIYAFCRYVDDLVDREPGGVAVVERVRRELGQLLENSLAGPPFAQAFASAVRRYDIPLELFEQLTEGVLRDRGPVQFERWEELRSYSYQVASVVGLMMVRVFEARDPAAEQYAIDLGIAMQLTNILRDIREDLQSGRVYLPSEELARFEIGRHTLEQSIVTENFREMMRFQIARARRFYDSAEHGIGLLRPDGSQWTVWIMRYVYAAILDEIEKADYDIFKTRVRTRYTRKVQLAWRAWLACHRR